MNLNRRAPGELEAEVLAALWALNVAATPAQIRAEVDPCLSYTTVNTILARLVGKREVNRHRAGRGFAYEPSKEQALRTALEVHEIFGTGEKRLAVLRHFINSMTSAEEAEVRRLLSSNDPKD